MKEQIVIIGAGLGGCCLAAGLFKQFKVTVVELSDGQPLLRDRVLDVACPAVTYPNIESGFGGTTKAWHNALMEINRNVFEKKWPFSKDTITPYYEKAYSILSGTNREHILKFVEKLRQNLINMGFPKLLLTQGMFIPKSRVNPWEKLALKNKVKTINGEVVELIPNKAGSIKEIKILKKGGGYMNLSADYFVLAAGGLSSPLLLKKLRCSLPLECLNHAGIHYEDHPVAIVAEVKLDQPLYKFWNYPIKTKEGNANVRIPFSFDFKGLNISFQLRPSHHLRLAKPRSKIIGVLNDLRNFPLNPINYWRLITQIDDILEILSFKFGLRLPTSKYSILMVAEQTPSSYCAIWKEDDSSTINRRWEIDEDYIETINQSIQSFLKILKPKIKETYLFSEWFKEVYSSSHHSGTARLSVSPKNGVCDINGQVHGISNLFVCDGSIIPGSGFVNTGLTIVALAMRMADFISSLSVSKCNEN